MSGVPNSKAVGIFAREASAKLSTCWSEAWPENLDKRSAVSFCRKSPALSGADASPCFFPPRLSNILNGAPRTAPAAKESAIRMMSCLVSSLPSSPSWKRSLSICVISCAASVPPSRIPPDRRLSMNCVSAPRAALVVASVTGLPTILPRRPLVTEPVTEPAVSRAALIPPTPRSNQGLVLVPCFSKSRRYAEPDSGAATVL